MKLLLAFFVASCIVAVYSEDSSKLHLELKSRENQIKECSEQTKVDAKTLEELHNTKVVPNSPEMKCFMACMMKKEGMMNDDGSLAQKFLEPAATAPCRDLGGKDECEVAYNVVNCLLKNELVMTKSD